MAIRITGMYSGLDTESIITELASAQSYKKSKLVKAQTKLSWKQDAWKALNTKIYSFYTNTLDNMRFQSSYMKKKTKISDTDALSVITGADAVNGVRKVKIDKLAKAAYLTGGSIAQGNTHFTGRATLKQLGFTGKGSISLTGGNGASFDLELDENMTIDAVVEKIKTTGLNASFDQNNQRIFVSSSNTGAVNNFTIMGNDEGGMNALAALGLLSEKDLKSDTNKLWASYKTDTAAYQKAIDAEVLARAEAYKKENDSLKADIEAYEKGNEKNQEELEKLAGYNAAETRDSVYEALYGKDVTNTTTETKTLDASLTTDADGNYVDGDNNIVYKKTDTGYEDADGNAVSIDTVNNEVTVTKEVTEHQPGSLQQAVDTAKETLKAAQDALAAANEGDADYDDLKADVEAAEEGVSNAQKAYDEAKDRYSFLNAIEHNKKGIEDAEKKIEENETYFEVDADGKVTGKDKLKDAVKEEFDKKVAVADKAYNGTEYADKAKGSKINGEDALITVNGAEFTSMSNTFTINGLTLDVQEEGKEVTLTTNDDTDGIYDMIKNFFSEYNKLINEMDSLYNAESSTGYEPLTSEEKEALADSEVEEWEKKIKDSLLRKDSTLSDVAGAMKEVLLKGAEIGGKQMYLSDFGINTLGYFNAKENERNAYYIDGDSDNAYVKAKENKLKAAIASDPETVMNFFSKLSNNLYDKLKEKMATSKASSAFTVYNDKTMKDDYKEYTEKIAKEEEKLNKLMDKWYDKFSAMETALAKLESKNSAISGMFGG